MAGWTIRKTDWFILDPNPRGEGILRRERTLTRAQSWMAGHHNLPMKEKGTVRPGESMWVFGPDAGGLDYTYQVVRGSELAGLTVNRRELNIAPKYPYPTEPYALSGIINREPLLRDPDFMGRLRRDLSYALTSGTPLPERPAPAEREQFTAKPPRPLAVPAAPKAPRRRSNSAPAAKRKTRPASIGRDLYEPEFCICGVVPYPCSWCETHRECEHCGEWVHEDEMDDHVYEQHSDVAQVGA